MLQKVAERTKIVKTTCGMCGIGCGLAGRIGSFGLNWHERWIININIVVRGKNGKTERHVTGYY